MKKKIHIKKEDRHEKVESSYYFTSNNGRLIYHWRMYKKTTKTTTNPPNTTTQSTTTQNTTTQTSGLPLVLLKSPTVSTMYPAYGDTDVPVNFLITANFDSAMSPSTINVNTFTLWQGTTPVPGIVNYYGMTAILIHRLIFKSILHIQSRLLPMSQIRRAFICKITSYGALRPGQRIRSRLL